MSGLVALALALTAAGVAVAAGGHTSRSAAYLAAGQGPDGGFAEKGREPDASLTAWAALALVAAGGSLPERARAGDYLRSHRSPESSDGGVALTVVALSALGRKVAEADLERLRRHRPGRLVNETIWCALGLSAAGERVPAALLRGLLAGQARDGGFPWSRGGAPDSNDTAAAIQALRAAGVTGAPVRRAVAALRTFQARNGGFSLEKGGEPDAQSTGWAIQALLSAGERPGNAPFRFLSRLRRGDGSYRYSARYATTPVWVTAQVVPALAGKSFPYR